MKKYKIVFLVFFAVFVLKGQVNTYSPYSYFGLGTVYNITSVSSMAMGGLGLTANNSYLINFNNPASYCFLDHTSFEIGTSSTSTVLTQNNLEQKNHISGLLNLGLGFPVSQKIGFAVGLFPFSNVGYNINSEVFNNDVIGNVNYNYSGSGGLNKLVFGIGATIINDLSFGLNINYFFGPINKYTDVETENSITQFQEQESFLVSDLNFDLGVLYQHKLGNKLMNVATYLAPESKLSVDKYTFQYTYITSGQYQSFMDTISYTNNIEGDIVMPMSYGLGFSLSSKDSWLVGIDYKYTNWTNYSFLGQIFNYMHDKNQIIFGTSFTPKKTDIYNYWNRIEYKMGITYSRGYLDLASLTNNISNNVPLEEFSISFGAALPLNKVFSKVNLGFRYGLLGTLQTNTTFNPIQEKYFSTYLSMTLNEKWFKKRKIQ